MAISRIRAYQRYKVPLPNFQLDWTATTEDLKFCSRTSVLSLTAKDLKFRFRTSALHWLPKIWGYASTLPWLPMIWISASASLLPHLRSPLTTHEWHEFRSALLLCQFFQRCEAASLLPSCLDCQRSEVQLPHFCSARTSKGLKLFFRTSALPWLPNIWSSAFQTSVLPGLRTISSPPPHLFDQDFQRCEAPLLHFISAGTSKDVKFLFRTSTPPWLPEIWKSASPLTLCFNCQKYEIPLPHFRSAMTAK